MASDLVDPLPAEAFSDWWLVGAIALAALAVLVLVGPRLWRSLRRPPAPAPAPAPASAAKSRSQAALDEIDRLEAAWTAGELTDRAAAQGIAAALKAFAGAEAATLTLLDLKAAGWSPQLVAVFEAAYPVEFGVKGEGDVAGLAARARQVVAR
ncbi:MAG: hypothetical protein LBD51_03615 [Bifidobacteriaceae bacterium]|nr:hypothetical protein [Bifidobacteriaceae bacterium]